MQTSKDDNSDKKTNTGAEEKIEQVSSKDIKNAHASGDGSIKRSDETIVETTKTKSGNTNPATENY